MAKFKKGQILKEACGCSYKILRVNKATYKVKNTADEDDAFLWDIEDMEKHISEDTALEEEMKEKPMQRFLDELKKTGVISDDFKGKLISYGYQIQEEAFSRGIKEGERRMKEAENKKQAARHLES
jgi:hypothetical protein